MKNQGQTLSTMEMSDRYITDNIDELYKNRSRKIKSNKNMKKKIDPNKHNECFYGNIEILQENLDLKPYK